MIYDDFRLATDSAMTMMAKEYLSNMQKRYDIHQKDALIKALYYDMWDIKTAISMQKDSFYQPIYDVINLNIENLECYYEHLDKRDVRSYTFRAKSRNQIIYGLLGIVKAKFALLDCEHREYVKSALKKMQTAEIDAMLEMLKQA